MNSVFISPHDDDQILFGAFTLLREKPLVIIVFDGHVQQKRGLPITARQRELETQLACAELGQFPIIRLGFRDDDPTVTPDRIRSRAGEVSQRLAGKRIFAPAWEEKGHDQHNLVAEAFGMADATHPTGELKGVTYYLTYTRNLYGGKSTSANEAPILEPDWVARKLRALACFESQFLPAVGCVEHFIGRSLREYYL